ncbi:MAG TPA: ferredoxin family protein [Nitrososphaeraceae archaeon]|nr:ferredoxin family protein [Nitrososphaeraceae archaeon]
MAREFICIECGSLLTHSNELTLESMKEVHSQLCIIKRQKLIAAQSIQDISSKSSPILQSTVQVSHGAAKEPSSMPSTTKPVIGETTISLTGSGTDHSKVDGPIDTSFKSKRQKAGKFKGISVWGPVDPPGQLGIWGDSVAVDFDICIGDGACIEACPVNVYEWLETPGHPGSEKKPFMAREKDCIFCLACENVCPPQAIKIYQK